MENCIDTRNNCRTTKESRNLTKYARKLAFTQFVKSHETSAEKEDTGTGFNQVWKCCLTVFTSLKDYHHHVAVDHKVEIKAATDKILVDGCSEARWSALKRKAGHDSDEESTNEEEMALPRVFCPDDHFPWLPCSEEINQISQDMNDGLILLFYKYRPIRNTIHIRNWQETLCYRLNLTGKIRVATEGINATVGGSKTCTDMYIKSIQKHPMFEDMTQWDFKKSTGSDHDFPDGLKVGIYQEIVPMGISPNDVSHESAGRHLSVDEFHEAVKDYKENTDKNEQNKLFVDCRNFYESKIGQFEGAVCPDIRKFSYWPEFVEKNQSLFENKDVYMYCTGGIRCERGSAYLLDKGICSNVYQLHGGIHKYIEKYPEGYFRGKLFVFDDRYHIKANEDILSKCRYCDTPWDQYTPCSSKHCHQLVLSCSRCQEGGHTACCPTCQGLGRTANDSKVQEQCECTKQRPRIPVENTS